MILQRKNCSCVLIRAVNRRFSQTSGYLCESNRYEDVPAIQRLGLLQNQRPYLEGQKNITVNPSGVGRVLRLHGLIRTRNIVLRDYGCRCIMMELNLGRSGNRGFTPLIAKEQPINARRNRIYRSGGNPAHNYVQRIAA